MALVRRRSGKEYPFTLSSYASVDEANETGWDVAATGVVSASSANMAIYALEHTGQQESIWMRSSNFNYTGLLGRSGLYGANMSL